MMDGFPVYSDTIVLEEIFLLATFKKIMVKNYVKNEKNILPFFSLFFICSIFQR